MMTKVTWTNFCCIMKNLNKIGLQQVNDRFDPLKTDADNGDKCRFGHFSSPPGTRASCAFEPWNMKISVRTRLNASTPSI